MKSQPASETAVQPNPLTRAGGCIMTLPKRYYTEPNILEREKEEIFHKSWQYAGHACQLPDVGSYFTLDYLDDSLLFVRDADRKIRGFYNVCQHRAHQLVKGHGCKKVLTCPYHAWSYGLDGRLRSARGTDRGQGFDTVNYGLEPVRVEMLNDIVMFNLDPAAPSFESLIPGVAAEMRREIPRLGEFVSDKLPDPTGFGVFAIDPLSVSQCRSRGHYFRLPGPDTAEEAARREYVAKVLWPEDEEICESVQQGLRSRGYRQGPIVAPDACDGGSETTVGLFQRLTLEALGEIPVSPGS